MCASLRSSSAGILACVGALALFTHNSRADIVFDSFTPPSTLHGFSSPNAGDASKVSVAFNITISGMAILNEMLSAGALRFCILDDTTHAFLLLTDAVSFPQDASGIPTWKDSTPFTFTLLGGHNYFIGYLRNVGVNDFGDFTAESQNGITSDLQIRGLSGFTSPTYAGGGFDGADFGVRLYAVPEPSTLVLLALSLLAVFGKSRARSCRSHANA